MFCHNCGKEVKEEWRVCPQCGARLGDTNERKQEGSQNVSEQANSPEYNSEAVPDEMDTKIKTDFTIGNSKITGRLILKVLALITIVCFFCPLYMISCAGRELGTINGLDLTLGFELMDQPLDGNLAYGVLLILPIINMCFAFVNEKKIKADEMQQVLRAASYGNAICSGTMLIYVWYMTASLQSAAEETALGIVPQPAVAIMEAVSLAGFVIGTYLAYLAEPREKKGKKSNPHIVKLKCIGKAFAGSVILLIVCMLPFGDGQNQIPNSDDYLQEEQTEEKEPGLSGVDMEDLLEVSMEDIEELGFEVTDQEAVACNGDVCIQYDDSEIIKIVIEGEPDEMPSFHDVTIGMEGGEAAVKLSDTYQETPEEALTFLNLDEAGKIQLEAENGSVFRITYLAMSDEEVEMARLQAESDEYIFPDSDKRYLSDEEVRSVSAEELRIGRNEIFARHGAIFESEDLQVYFSERPWYSGKIPVSEINLETEFNDFEKRNIELIKSIENETGGAQQSNIDTSFIAGYVAEAGYYSADSGLYIYIDQVNGNQVDFMLADEMSVLDWFTGTIVDKNTMQYSGEQGNITIKFNGNYSFKVTGNIGEFILDGTYYINAG